MYVVQFETLIKSNFDFFMCLNSIEIYVCRSIQNNTLYSIIRVVLHLVKEHWSMTDNYEVYMSYVYHHERHVLLDTSWRWKYTGVPWLSYRDGMRDPVVVGLHVWRGEDGRDVETELWQGLWQGRQISQDKSSGLAES